MQQHHFTKISHITEVTLTSVRCRLSKAQFIPAQVLKLWTGSSCRSNKFPTDLQLLPKTFCFTKNLWGAFQSSGQHHLYSQNRMFHKIYCALQNGIILISMQGRKYFHHPAAECYEQISAGPESELTITHANRLYRKTSQPRITSLRLSYIVMFVGENLR